MDIRSNTWYQVTEDRPNTNVLVMTSAMQLPDSVLIRTTVFSTDAIFNDPTSKKEKETSPTVSVIEVANLKLAPVLNDRNRVTFKRLQQGEYPPCFPAE